MQKFLNQFQIDSEDKVIAGVCAGIANYLNIKTIYVRLLAVLLLLSPVELAMATVVAYLYLAGWLSRGEGSIDDKKARNNAVLIYVLLLILAVGGKDIIPAVFEVGRTAATWLASLI